MSQVSPRKMETDHAVASIVEVVTTNDDTIGGEQDDDSFMETVTEVEEDTPKHALADDAIDQDAFQVIDINDIRVIGRKRGANSIHQLKSQISN